MMGGRYTKALRAGIESLSSKELEVDTGSYTIKVLEDNGDVSVEVYVNDGGLLETHEYLRDNIIDESSVGESWL